MTKTVLEDNSSSCKKISPIPLVYLKIVVAVNHEENSLTLLDVARTSRSVKEQ